MDKLVILSMLTGLAAGHAIVTNPVPWNTNPSTQSPCGGGSRPSLITTQWVVGSTQTIVWKVVASDGAGKVSVKLSESGDTTFTSDVTITGGNDNPTTVASYALTITVPNVDCDDTNGCTIQVMSSSNWASCFSVKIVDATPSPIPLPSTACVVVNSGDLTFCDMLAGRSVRVGTSSLAQKDSEAALAFEDRYKSEVFSKGNKTDCGLELKNFLCGLNFPSCKSSGQVCNSRCVNGMRECGLTTSHQGLYVCNLYKEFKEDSVGSCPAGKLAVGGKEAAVVIVAFIVVGLAAWGGYYRNKRWASPNLGYKSTIGFTMVISAFIAFACAAQSVNYARKSNPEQKVKFEAKSYVNYLVAANLLAFLCMIVFLFLDFKKTISEKLRKIVLVVDTILLIMTLAAAAAATKHFSGNLGYCKFEFSNLNECTTYQASIFFTYVVFLGLFFKLLVTILSRKFTKADDRATV